MKFRLVDALREDGTPINVDGERKGLAFPFIRPRDMIVVRTSQRTTMDQAQKLIKMLEQALNVRVLVVDDRVEILVMESWVGTLLRKMRLRYISVVAGFAALWFSARAKFAMIRSKS